MPPFFRVKTMLFTPVTLAALNTPVQSSSVTVTVAGTVAVTSGNAVVYVDGVNRGSSSSVLVGDSLAIRINTSGGLNATATHALFTINGAPHSFTCVTQYSASGVTAPMQFYVTSANEVPVNGTIVTNVMTLVPATNTGTFQLSVPPALYGAFITKNGVNVGTTALATGGDTFTITLTAPSTYSEQIELPIFIGNKYSVFSAVTQGPKDVPVSPPYFPNVVNAVRGATVQSSVYTVSGLDSGRVVSFILSSGSCVAYKNGLVVSTPFSVGNGDTIRLSLSAANTYADTMYVVFSLGASGPLSWAVTTAPNYDGFIDAAFLKKSVFDVPLVGHTDASLNQDNVLLKINTTTHAVTNTTGLYNPAVIPDGSPSTFLHSSSYYEGLIHKIGLSGSVTDVTSLDPGVFVYGTTYAPRYNLSAAVTTRRFASLSGTLNVVRELGSANPDIPVTGGALYGIASSKDGSYLYVATQASMLVTLIRDTVTSPYYTSQYYALASKCDYIGGFRDVVVDPAGNVWISDLSKGQLIVMRGTDMEYLGRVLLGTDPWAMACSDTHMFVAGGSTNTLVQVNLSTRLIVRTVDVRSVPSSVSVDPLTGNVWVGYYGGNYITVHTPGNNYGISNTILLSQPVTAITIDGDGNAWAQCLYKDLATYQNPRLRPASQMTPLTFAPVVEAPRNAQITSEELTVANLARPAVLSVPPINGNSILKNGGAASYSATVDNGDLIALQSVTPDKYYKTTSIVATEANVQNTWSYRTLSDTTPDNLYFDAITDSALSTTVLSSGAPVTGLSPGVVLHIELDDPSWTLYVNGTPAVTGYTADVVYGDVISIGGSTTGLSFGGVLTKGVLYEESPSVFAQFGALIIQAVPAPVQAPSNPSGRGRHFVDTSWIKRETYITTYAYHNAAGWVKAEYNNHLVSPSDLVHYARKGYAGLQRVVDPVRSPSIGVTRAGLTGDMPTAVLNQKAHFTASTPVASIGFKTVGVTTSTPSWVLLNKVKTLGGIDPTWVKRETRSRLVVAPTPEYTRLETHTPVYVPTLYEKNALLPYGYRRVAASYFQQPALRIGKPVDTHWFVNERLSRPVTVKPYTRIVHTPVFSPDVEYLVTNTTRIRFPDTPPTWLVGESRVQRAVDPGLVTRRHNNSLNVVPRYTPTVRRFPRHTQPMLSPVVSNTTRMRYSDSQRTPEKVWTVNEDVAGPINSQGIFTTPAQAIADGIYRGYPNCVSYEMTTIVTDDGTGTNQIVPAFMWVVPYEPGTVPVLPPSSNLYPIPTKWYVSGG